MFKFVEAENSFIGQTKYGHSLAGKYAEYIDPRAIYTLVYELRNHEQSLRPKVTKQFTGEQLIFNHFSSKELILDWYDEQSSDADADQYLSQFVQNFVSMSCYPSIMGRTYKTSRLLKNVTGSPKVVLDYVANDNEYKDEILSCFLYMKIKEGYNSLYCVDHLFNCDSDSACNEFLDNFVPSHPTLKNRSPNGSLQLKGASGFLECIPFNM